MKNDELNKAETEIAKINSEIEEKEQAIKDIEAEISELIRQKSYHEGYQKAYREMHGIDLKEIKEADEDTIIKYALDIIPKREVQRLQAIATALRKDGYSVDGSSIRGILLNSGKFDNSEGFWKVRDTVSSEGSNNSHDNFLLYSGKVKTNE